MTCSLELYFTKLFLYLRGSFSSKYYMSSGYPMLRKIIFIGHYAKIKNIKLFIFCLDGRRTSEVFVALFQLIILFIVKNHHAASSSSSTSTDINVPLLLWYSTS